MTKYIKVDIKHRQFLFPSSNHPVESVMLANSTPSPSPMKRTSQLSENSLYSPLAPPVVIPPTPQPTPKPSPPTTPMPNEEPEKADEKIESPVVSFRSSALSIGLPPTPTPSHSGQDPFEV